MRKSLHPNQQDDLGYTLLHHATLNGHREVVSFLLRCSASTTIPDCSGKVAAMALLPLTNHHLVLLQVATLFILRHGRVTWKW